MITTRRTTRAVLMVALAAALVVCGASIATGQEGLKLELKQEPGQSTNPIPADATRVAVHGMVRNAVSGEPLARALVQIQGDAETGTLTDGEGRFEIPGVPVGPQIFRVVKPGYRDRPYAAEDSGGQEDEGPAHSVLVAAQMPELNFALSPNGAIHGRIDLSTGDAADGINVLLLRQEIRFGRSVWGQQGTTRSNGDGAYRFGGLADGVYAVLTQPALETEPAVSVVATGRAANVARSGFPAVYYPDAHDLAGATRIRLSNGSQAEANFLLALEPFYAVTVIAAAPADASGGGKAGQPVSSTAVVMDSTGHLLPYSAQYDDATHSLQADLPDGTYVLVVRGFLPPHSEFDRVVLSGKSFGRSEALVGSAEFTVAGHAISGLRVPLSPPQATTVHVRVVHNPDIPANSAVNGVMSGDPANLTLDPADGAPLNNSENVWSMDNQPDAITFTAQPGSYWLRAYLPRRGLCAGPLTAGSFNLAREPLVLSLATSPPPMELVLRDDCGTLALTLPPALESFLPGEEPYYTLYVVPDFDTVQNIPPMTMHPSSGATLTLDSLTPGSYHVYFFDSPVHLEYRNPAALGALANPGQQVSVSAGATTNLVLEAPVH